MTGEKDAFALSQHGTSVAGVIAMVKDNNKCGVGIAYNCTITGEKSVRIDLLCEGYEFLKL